MIVLLAVSLLLFGCHTNTNSLGLGSHTSYTPTSNKVRPTLSLFSSKSKAVTNKIQVVYLPRIYTVDLRFTKEATNCYNWDVESSIDNKNWFIVERNIYTVNHIMFPTNSPIFYRLVG